MTSAKITRTRTEVRRYERSVEIALDMAPRQTRADAQTVVVTQKLGDLGRYETGEPRVVLNVTRTTKKGEPTYSGKRAYDLALVDAEPSRWGDHNDFTPETIDRLRELRDAVLDEWASIDWEAQRS